MASKKSQENKEMLAFDFTDDLESAVDISLGEWLIERRVKKGLSLDTTAMNSGISKARMESLEKGEAAKGITRSEAESLAKVFGIDPRAIFKRAIEGW